MSAADDEVAIELAHGFLQAFLVTNRLVFQLIGSASVDGPQEGSGLWRAIARKGAIATGVEPLVDEARAGDLDAHCVLLGISRDMIEQRLTLDEPLAGYVVDFLNGTVPPKRRPGHQPRSRSKFNRDYLIAVAVGRTIALGYKLSRGSATRDRHPDRHSACSIVAAALERVVMEDPPKELGVEEIWRKCEAEYGHTFGSWPRTTVVHLSPGDPAPSWLPPDDVGRD